MAKVGSFRFYIAVAVACIIFVPPFAKYQELRHKNRRLDEQIADLKRENKRLLEEKHRLETDIGYIEKKARENIGVVRKGEIVIKERSP